MHTVKLRYWVMWALAAFFFLIDYIIRISPSIVANQLMATFQVDAVALGFLTAIYHYTYATMQIPVGVLFDRYGVRGPLVMAVAVCTVGVLLMAVAHSIELLYVARFLTGFAGAFAFVAALKLIQLNFPHNYFALLAGVTQMLGMVGAAIGDAPVAALMDRYGWYHVNYGLTIIFVLLTIAIVLFVRNPKATKVASKAPVHPAINVMASIKQVVSNKQTWINAAYIGFLYGPTAAFAGLWAVPYFMVDHHEPNTVAAFQVGFIWIGLAVGCPVMGWLSNRMGKRLPLMWVSSLGSLLLISLAIFGGDWFPLIMSPTATCVLLFLYGFMNCGIIPSYALATESNPLRLSGITLGVTNMASIGIGVVLLPSIGRIMKSAWNGVMVHGHPLYTVSNYQLALLVLPGCCIISFIFSFLLKETYCQPLDEERAL